MQGDKYLIPFTISDENGLALTPTELTKIEFTIGELTKTYPEAITFDNSKWYFPLTQEEAFNFEGGKPQTAQVRVKFENGDIIGTEAGIINIIESISKGEL